MIGTDTALPVHEHEARAVDDEPLRAVSGEGRTGPDEAAQVARPLRVVWIDHTQLEAICRQPIDLTFGPGQEQPLLRIGTMALGILGQDFGRVALWIHRNRHQPEVWLR